MCLAFSAGALDTDQAAPLVISGTAIKGLIDIGSPGPYNAVYNVIEKTYPGEIEFTVRPVRRAVRVFVEHESDCFFVGTNKLDYYESLGMPRDQVLTSDGINHIKLHVYTRPEDPIISSKEAMAAKTYAVDVTAGSSDYFKKKILPEADQIFYAQTIEQAFEMLRQKRVQAVLAFDIDRTELLKRVPEAAQYRHDPSFTVLETVDAFACWRSKATEVFIKHVNETVASLESTGRLQAILAGE